jgi:hypothetical protein
MSYAIRHAYNLAPSLADQLTASAVQLDQGRGWIDLHDLNALNVSSAIWMQYEYTTSRQIQV